MEIDTSLRLAYTLISFADYVIGVYFLWVLFCVLYFGFKIGLSNDPFENLGYLLDFIRYVSFGIIKNDN